VTFDLSSYTTQDDGNSELLQEQFAQNIDKSVVLDVYSSKEQSVRGNI
jgi:hypothetical protein